MAILEDLRTADRLVAGAIATLRYAQRQQRLDLIGVINTEGAFDTQTQRDNGSAANDLVEAEAALRQVEKRLAIEPTTAELDLRHWRLWTDLAGGLFDLIPLANLGHNLDSASRLQAGIRRLFATLRDADPDLAARAAPLTDWDDGPSEWATSWRYNRGPMLLVGAVAVVWLVVSLLSG